MKDQKPRYGAVDTSIARGDSILCKWDEQKGTISIDVLRDGKVVGPRRMTNSILYPRAKKPKVINRMEFSRGGHFTLSHLEALMRYEQVWAVDTNHRELFGKTVNASVVTVWGRDEIIIPVLGYFFGATKNNPELFAYRRFIEYAMGHNAYREDRHYALIIDSELSRIPKFNSGEEPIHGAFHLPRNWTMHYASSDTGKDFLPNRILSMSDKFANLLLDNLAQTEAIARFFEPLADEESFVPRMMPLLKSPPGRDRG